MLQLNVNPTPPPAGPKYELFRVRPGIIETFTVLSRSHFGMSVHWAHGKTWPCMSNGKPCEECAGGKRPRWHCYLYVYSHQHKKDGHLELSPNAWEELKKSVALEMYDGLRGVRFNATRKTKNSTVKITLLEKLEKLEKYQEAIHPLVTLWGLWKKPADEIDYLLKEYPFN